jgi:hypothetical protein
LTEGLSKSRYGVVVLSEHFFRKRWTEWELDGLVQRQLDSSNRLIIPIWHGVNRKMVLEYSAPLADIVAIQSRSSLEVILTELLRILFPAGSTLLIAREALIAKGFEPPVVTDDWWLDVVQSAQYQSERRWCFPVWKMTPEGAHRGENLAWQALQQMWQEEAEIRPITQITRPDALIEFIDSQPGLSEVCAKFPERLLDYAPQLAIPTIGGKWEPVFDELLARSIAESERRRERDSISGTGLTTDGRTPACEDNLALRHSAFGNYESEHVACGFVQGNGAGIGPVVQAFDNFDYLIWLISDESTWMPETHRAFLLDGMINWGVWIQYADRPQNDAFKPIPESGTFWKQLYSALEDGSWKRFHLSPAALKDLRSRISAVREALNLPESTEELLQKFLQTDCIARWFKLPWQRRQRRRKSLRKLKRSK